jgi:hypothetical protein
MVTFMYYRNMNKVVVKKQKKPSVQKWTKQFVAKYKPALQELAKK